MFARKSKISLLIVAYILLPVLIVFGIVKQDCLKYYYERSKSFFYRESNNTTVNEVIQQKDSVINNRYDFNFITEDTVFYNRYKIIHISGIYDTVHFENNTYIHYKDGILILKAGKIFYERSETSLSPNTEFGFFQAISNHPKSLVLQQWSGGAHCCETGVLLDLSDSVHTLFNSDEYKDELNGWINFSDLDEDSNYILTNEIRFSIYLNHINRELYHTSVTYFKYSSSECKYILSNRLFAENLLSYIQEQTDSIKAIADTINFAKFKDPNCNYLQLVLGVVVDYTYAGKKDTGWAFFNQWYKLADKEKVREEIQSHFDESSVYNELYNGNKNYRKRNLTRYCDKSQE